MMYILTQPPINRLVKFGQLALCGLLAATNLHGTEPVRVVMQLDWIFNAQFAGIYQAVEQGYFADKNLEVTIQPVDPEQKTVPAVLAEPLAFGCAESNVLLKAHAEGAPIKALATMFQGSPIGWMYVAERGIRSFADLAGKRIGIHSDGEKVIGLVSRQAGVKPDDFVLPHVGYDIGILLEGEIDAMQAYSIDEFVKLQLATGGTAGMFMARDLGYSAYSQVIFTTETVVEQHPETVRDFLEAVQRGWTYALENKEATVDLILKKYNPGLDRAYQLASLRKIDELVRPGGQNPLAPIKPAVFKKSLTQYLESGMLEKGTDLDDLLDLRFNP
jgi:ABC-type nitrate/sulfonate/bicarbonate transport system substrate-binding protein